MTAEIKSRLVAIGRVRFIGACRCRQPFKDMTPGNVYSVYGVIHRGNGFLKVRNDVGKLMEYTKDSFEFLPQGAG